MFWQYLKRIILTSVIQFIAYPGICQEIRSVTVAATGTSDTCSSQHRFIVNWENEAMPAELDRTTIRFSYELIHEIISRAMSIRMQILSAYPNSPVSDAEFSFHSGQPTDVITAKITVRGNDAEKSLRTLLAEIDRILNHGFTGDEIQRTKYEILEKRRIASDSVPPARSEYRLELTERTLPLLDDETINQAAAMAISAENMTITHIRPAEIKSDKKTGKQKKSRKKQLTSQYGN